MDKVMEKWNEILQMVKEEHGLTDVSFNTWIKPLEVFAIDGNTLYILVPSEQMGLSYINKKYYLPLKVAIGEVTGIEYDIQFILPDQAQSLKFKNNQKRRKTTKNVAYADNFFLPFNLLAANTFLPLAVFILCLNP